MPLNQNHVHILSRMFENRRCTFNEQDYQKYLHELERSYSSETDE